MKQLRHTLITIIGALLLISTPLSHAQLVEDEAGDNVFVFFPEIVGQLDCYIATTRHDQNPAWTGEVGTFVSTPLNARYELYYRPGSLTDERLRQLELAERRALLEQEILPLAGQLTDGQIQQVLLEETDETYTDVRSMLKDRDSGVGFQAKKKGRVITLSKKPRA